MDKLYTIDRIEGEIVVLEMENGSHINALRSLVPGNAKEGDVLETAENGFVVREDLTQERRDKILQKQKKLFKHRSEET